MIDERKSCCNKSRSSSKDVMEVLWLRYYNAVLLEKGLITNEMYKRIEREILNRPASRKRI